MSDSIWVGEVGQTVNSSDMSYQDKIDILGKPIADTLGKGNMTESTEQTIDEAMVNLEEGKAGDPVELPTETVEEQAARYLMGALPTFRHKLKRLEESNRTEVGRVLSALIEAPLEQETHHFTTQKAQELYELGLIITNAKLLLFNSALKIESVVEQATEQAIEDGKKEEQV